MEHKYQHSIYKPSETAIQSYRNLNQANRIFYALLGVLVLLGIWNVFYVASLIRSGVTDLAAIGEVGTHISTRLITLVAIVALALFIYKEWKWGDRGFVMAYPLAALLFLWLVPVMSAEIQPAEESMVVMFTLNECETGAIVDRALADSSLCELVAPDSYNVQMATSNPFDSDAQILAPSNEDSFGHGWPVEARGRFQVYFMVEQPSMEACQNTEFVTNQMGVSLDGDDCLEHEGAVWKVYPFVTSTEEGGRLSVSYVREP